MWTEIWKEEPAARLFIVVFSLHNQWCSDPGEACLLIQQPASRFVCLCSIEWALSLGLGAAKRKGGRYSMEISGYPSRLRAYWGLATEDYPSRGIHRVWCINLFSQSDWILSVSKKPFWKAQNETSAEFLGVSWWCKIHRLPVAIRRQPGSKPSSRLSCLVMQSTVERLFRAEWLTSTSGWDMAD